jgi:hypothetical protein
MTYNNIHIIIPVKDSCYIDQFECYGIERLKAASFKNRPITSAKDLRKLLTLSLTLIFYKLNLKVFQKMYR